MGSIKLAAGTFIDPIKKVEDPDSMDYQLAILEEWLDYLFNLIYLCEFLIKSVAMGLYLDKNCYLSVGLNKLDFIIVVASINETIVII